MKHSQRLNHYLAPTLFAAAAALFIITGVEYLKLNPGQESFSSLAPVAAEHARESKIAKIYRKTTGRIEVGFERFSKALGIGPAKIEPAKLSRMAVIQHRGEAFQILGIKSGTALSERRVVVRDMGSNKIGEFAAGERVFGGARIEIITAESVQILVEAPQRRLIQLNNEAASGRIL